MARKVRVEFGGACYHVINRSNYGRAIFGKRGAAAAFERCLNEACLRFRWRIHAFVILRNHFHLAVETPEPNLSTGMKWLQGTWVTRINRFHGEIGRPFQGRFKALHVEPGHALAQVAHYIHLNPVRAGIVTAAKLPCYRWSSLRLFACAVRPGWLEPGTVLRECGGLADSAAGWRSYLNYLDVIAERDGTLRDEKFRRLSRGWAIGSSDFKTQLAAELVPRMSGSPRFALLGVDHTALSEARAAMWEEQLQRLADAFALRLDHLPAKKSDPDKVRLAAAMKSFTSASNHWLAGRIHMGTGSSVSALVSQFHRRGESRAVEFRKVLSQFAT